MQIWSIQIIGVSRWRMAVSSSSVIPRRWLSLRTMLQARLLEPQQYESAQKPLSAATYRGTSMIQPRSIPFSSIEWKDENVGVRFLVTGSHGVLASSSGFKMRNRQSFEGSFRGGWLYFVIFVLLVAAYGSWTMMVFFKQKMPEPNDRAVCEVKNFESVKSSKLKCSLAANHMALEGTCLAVVLAENNLRSLVELRR